MGPTHTAYLSQWLFLVPLKSGRWHIIPQLAVYIPLIFLAFWGVICYQAHLLGEPFQQPLTIPRHPGLMFDPTLVLQDPSDFVYFGVGFFQGLFIPPEKVMWSTLGQKNIT